ncbi:hypothetical protein NKI94_26140 [Mesorhizobium australicum]|uniref:hypothetical protein n=1 Tax=Mesorhizobium australicum TaxID=536018 RepID=UPI003339733A
MKGLEPRGEVVSFDEGGKVIFKLSVGLIVILPDVSGSGSSVRAVAQWVVGLGETVIDAAPPAGSVDGVAAPARGCLTGLSPTSAACSCIHVLVPVAADGAPRLKGRVIGHVIELMIDIPLSRSIASLVADFRLARLLRHQRHGTGATCHLARPDAAKAAAAGACELFEAHCLADRTSGSGAEAEPPRLQGEPGNGGL